MNSPDDCATIYITRLGDGLAKQNAFPAQLLACFRVLSKDNDCDHFANFVVEHKAIEGSDLPSKIVQIMTALYIQHKCAWKTKQ